MNEKAVKGYFFVLASAVIYGCMPLMAKYIYADGVNPITLVFLRNFLALPSLAILAYAKNKTLRIPCKTLPSISLISFFGCCITPILLFSSYNYIVTGTATVFHFIYPSLVVLIEILFLKKKVPHVTLISITLCFVGICLFYDSAAPLRWEGAVTALASGITFATYVVLLSNYKERTVSGILLSFYIAAASSVMTFILCVVTGSLALPQSLFGWILCVGFALAVTTVAVVFFQQGTFIIGGEKTSILSALEPITSIVIGVIAFGEPLAARVLFGSALVVAASICIAVTDMKTKNKVNPHTR